MKILTTFFLAFTCLTGNLSHLFAYDDGQVDMSVEQQLRDAAGENNYNLVKELIGQLEGLDNIGICLISRGPNLYLDAIKMMYGTALMIASLNGNENIIRLLLDSGADPKVANIDNKTAIDFAKDDHIKEMLESHISSDISTVNSADNN